MGNMYRSSLPFSSEIATRRDIPENLIEHGFIERVYSNFTALVSLEDGTFCDGVLIPSYIGAMKGSKIKGRVPILQKGQFVVMRYFNDKKNSAVILSVYPLSLDNNKEMQSLYDMLEKDEIDYTEDFVDMQDNYRIVYKKDRYFIYDISNKKEIFSFTVKDKQFYFGDSKMPSSNERVSVNLDKDEKVKIGKGDMNSVSLVELKTWMDDLKKWMEDTEKWMEDTEKSIKGIMDALKNSSTGVQDGGATYKSGISSSLGSVKQPKVVKTITYPEKTKLGDTNLLVSKKGS